MANKPATWELYTLADGQMKISMAMDTKVPNAATFTIQKEDHTLANVLRNSVLANKNVIFCGYKVPHPLEPLFLLKIQTNGEISPKDVLVFEINKLIKSVEDLSKMFSVTTYILIIIG